MATSRSVDYVVPDLMSKAPIPGARRVRRSPAAAFGPVATALGALALLLAAGCRGPTWAAGADLIVPPRRVAKALGDPVVPPLDTFDPSSVPDMDPPTHTRPCCSFGMDLRVQYEGVLVPGYVKANLVSATQLGRHEYDHGMVSMRPDGNLSDVEQNGLLYTCRAGFVDIAHIRDYADLTFYIALRIARALPQGATLELAGDGALRRVTIAPISEQVVAEHGRFVVAAALAEQAAYQLSLWHEIGSFYGVEAVPGFSERVSAFSPEDLYSNVLGIKIGAALVDGQIPPSRDAYNSMVDSWIQAVLEHLVATPLGFSRDVMRSLDGVWWDSKKILPDTLLVTRRYMDIVPPIEPWRIEDVFPPDGRPAALGVICGETSRPLPLPVSDALGSLRMADVLSIEIHPGPWALSAGTTPESPFPFPFPDPTRKSFSSRDFPAILKDVHARMEAQLGPGVDRPAATKRAVAP